MGGLKAIYFVDEFMSGQGEPIFVVADVTTEINPDTDREFYTGHTCYFAKQIAPRTYYAYEKISLGSNVKFQDLFENLCILKGARVYVSAKA